MKKILAMMLTAAMMLSMGTAAMADETVVTPDDMDEVTITKIYKLVGDETAVSPAETFTYSIVYGAEIAVTDEDGNLVYETVENEAGEQEQVLKTEMVYVTDSTIANAANDAVPVPTINAGVSYEADAATIEGTNGTLTITLPDNYTTVGVYYYTITETVGDTAGVTYYTSPIVLKVTVIQDTETDKIEVAAVHAETPYDGSVGTKGDGTKLDNITNTYSAGKLTVTKEVDGMLGDQTKKFDITVTFTAPVVEDEEGEETFLTVKEAISYTVGNDTTVYTIAKEAWENGVATATVQLAHDDSVNFVNIPYGVTYAVSEASYASEGYNAPVITYSDEANKEIDGQVTDTVTVLNVKDGDIDTGISVDSIPYIAMLGVVAIGGAGVVVSKKRRSED